MIHNKLYTYNRLTFVVIIFCIFIIPGCEDPSSTPETDNSTNNTLDQSSLGGKEGEVLSYFYNFTQDISSKFLYYPNKSKIASPSTMDPLQDTLTLRTFSEYLLSISRDDFTSQAIRMPLDTIANLNYLETIPWKKEYRPISHYKWDDEGNGRYKQEVQDALVTIHDTLIYSQIEYFNGSTFDSLIFQSVIDSNITSNSELTFVDKGELTKKVVQKLSGEDITISDTIYYERRYIEDTSLLKLKSADCNDDGLITASEINNVSSGDECPAGSIPVENDQGLFCDKGNGKWDEEEFYLDLDGITGCDSGFYEGAWKDGAEPFQDRNCNNKYDEAEERVSSASECPDDSIPVEDGQGLFCDKGNGIWDAEEWSNDATDIVFFNIENDVIINVDTLSNNWSQNEPFFKITSRLDNLIVDYADSVDPKALKEVYYEVSDTNEVDGSIDTVKNSIVIKVGTETGWQYLRTSNLISSEEAMVVYNETFEEIDRYETTYSNVVIEQTDSYCANSNYQTKEECESAQFNWIAIGEEEEYIIMKSKWSEHDTSLYDYHAFRNRTNGDIVKLFHPYYFKHYGYFDKGIWFDNNVFEEIFLYTKGGILREGEDIGYQDTLIITPTGDYNIRTEYQVEADTIIVPYTVWEIVNGQIVCKNDNSEVDGFTQCTPGSDAFINDCFKITRTRTITLIANGVEYGHRNTEWLAKDMGIVKSLHETRWSEAIWDQGQQWTKIALWELMDINIPENYSSGLSRLLSDRIKYIDPIKLNQLDEFDQEPYLPSPLFGLHRLKFHE